MKNGDRVLGAFLALVLMLGLTACSDEIADKETKNKEPEKSLYEYGMDLVDLTRQQADSEEMIMLTLFSDVDDEELNADSINELRDFMTSEPIASMARMRASNLDHVYQIDISVEPFWEFALSRLNKMGLDADQVPPELRDQLLDRVGFSILLNIDAYLGYDSLLAKYGSVNYVMLLLNNFQFSKTFDSDELEENTAYLYVFEDAAVMVVFTKSEEGIVTATSRLALSDEILYASRSEIRQTLKDIVEDHFDITVTDITP